MKIATKLGAGFGLVLTLLAVGFIVGFSALTSLNNIVVTTIEGRPILLWQVASVEFAPKVKRGDAGYMSKPAVVVSVEKQPNVDTVQLTEDWAYYTIPFNEMRQGGYGKVAEVGLDLTSAYSITLGWGPGNVDFFLDNVSFYRTK